MNDGHDSFSLFAEPPRRGKAFSHDRSENTKHEWLTDPALIKTLGSFDLDPCAPVPEIRPWDTAAKHYDIETDGLVQPWTGRVWLNPPYENAIAGKFLARMVAHGNGIVLIYARTETDNFFRYVWGGGALDSVHTWAAKFLGNQMRRLRLRRQQAHGEVRVQDLHPEQSGGEGGQRRRAECAGGVWFGELCHSRASVQGRHSGPLDAN